MDAGLCIVFIYPALCEFWHIKLQVFYSVWLQGTALRCLWGSNVIYELILGYHIYTYQINFLKCKANSEFKNICGPRDWDLSVYLLLWLYLVLTPLPQPLPDRPGWNRHSFPGLKGLAGPRPCSDYTPAQLFPLPLCLAPHQVPSPLYYFCFLLLLGKLSPVPVLPGSFPFFRFRLKFLLLKEAFPNSPLLVPAVFPHQAPCFVLHGWYINL